MNETSLKNVMDQALAEGEPPIGHDLLGGVLRAARRTRRRQVAGVIAAVAAITPAIIFGAPPLASALGSLDHGHRPGVVTSRHHGKRSSLRAYAYFGGSTTINPPLFRPSLPSAVHEVNPVPITSQSFGQLLIDQMPGGATPSQVIASVVGPGSNHPAQAGFKSVYTRAGAGVVRAELYRAARPDRNFECQRTPTVSCAIYRLPHGIEVSEYSNTKYDGVSELMVRVSVFRPGIGIFSIEETNIVLGGNLQTFNAPLTMPQMVRVALDPRWGFTISRSFVQKASGLRVAAVPPGF